jgi:hypothetical protein
MECRFLESCKNLQEGRQLKMVCVLTLPLPTACPGHVTNLLYLLFKIKKSSEDSPSLRLGLDHRFWS